MDRNKSKTNQEKPVKQKKTHPEVPEEPTRHKQAIEAPRPRSNEYIKKQKLRKPMKQKKKNPRKPKEDDARHKQNSSYRHYRHPTSLKSLQRPGGHSAHPRQLMGPHTREVGPPGGRATLGIFCPAYRPNTPLPASLERGRSVPRSGSVT